MSVEDLVLAEMERPASPYPCYAQFNNDTPAGWNVSIIRIASVFYYDDGTNAQAGPVATNIRAGESRRLESPFPAKCTVKVFGVIMVQGPGEPPQNFSRMNNGQPGHCMLLTHFTLAPKPAVAKDSIGERLLLGQVVAFEETTPIGTQTNEKAR